MNLSLEGEEATSKTTTAYTSPLPIVGFSWDLGTLRAIYGTKYPDYFDGLNIEIIKPGEGDWNKSRWKENDITVFELPRPIQLSEERLKGFTQLWEQFMGLYSEAVLDKRIRSVVIDTMTLCRRIKAEAHLQWLQEKNPNQPRKQLLQIEYGPTNDTIRNLYDIAEQTNTNLIAVHHLTDEYKPVPGKEENQPTGNRILEGLGGTYRYVDVALRLEKNSKPVPSNPAVINGKITKCGYSLGLEGLSIADPTWDKVVDLVMGATGNRIPLERRIMG